MLFSIRATILAVALFLPTFAGAESAFTPPAVETGENGWEDYIEPPMIDKTSARGLQPALDSAEGAVVRYLASRVRNDRDWRGAMTSDPDRKARKALKQWKSWTLNAAQIKARKLKENRGYIRVWMDFTISGDNDSGTDDFTVIREGGGWRVASPPS